MDHLKTGLDEAIDRAILDGRILGTEVIVAKGGEVVYRRAAGLADREAGRPMREDAIFLLASITKPFVTAAALRLVEQGALALDQPVSRWLPEFRPALRDGTRPEITLAQLLTHRSGLAYRFWEPQDSAYHRLNLSDGLDQPGLSLAENLARLAQAPLVFPPGAAWRYSLGIDVLGAVMEAASGRGLAEILRTEIMEPLGIRETGFSVADPERLATPYLKTPEGLTRMEGTMVAPMDGGALRFSPERIFDPASYPSGGAGMAGLARETLALLEAIRKGGGPILRPETVAEMTRNQTGPLMTVLGPGWGFGYGWAVLLDPAQANTPQSRGTLQWGGVYGHSWFVDPAREMSVAALTNSAFEGMNGRFVVEIRNAACR